MGRIGVWVRTAFLEASLFPDRVAHTYTYVPRILSCTCVALHLCSYPGGHGSCSVDLLVAWDSCMDDTTVSKWSRFSSTGLQCLIAGLSLCLQLSRGGCTCSWRSVRSSGISWSRLNLRASNKPRLSPFVSEARSSK